ncbi:OmpA family protein, partial [Bacteroidota bacterium]
DCQIREVQYKSDLKNANKRIDNLNIKISKLNKDLDEMGAIKDELFAKKQALLKQIEEISDQALSQKQKMDVAMKSKLSELEKREKAIQELENLMNEKDQAMRSLLGNIEKALKQYASDELSINMVDGKVYVAMSDKLLFKSGSANVEPAGKEALSLLAGVLSKNPDLSIIIEGHTDNVPISTSRFTDNWDLSVIRATSVVRILVNDYNLNPIQVTASGKGEYYPKADNETPEGRAINRRTEIIIAPNLDEVFQLLNK